MRFLTDGKFKDTNLYFHQRSWLADSASILFFSSREPGGLLGYVVETGELVRLTAADGTALRHPTAAKLVNSVFALAGDRVLEIALDIHVQGEAENRRAKVTARERWLCTVQGIDVLPDGLRGDHPASVARRTEPPADRPRGKVLDPETVAVEPAQRFCAMVEGEGLESLKPQTQCDQVKSCSPPNPPRFARILRSEARERGAGRHGGC